MKASFSGGNLELICVTKISTCILTGKKVSKKLRRLQIVGGFNTIWKSQSYNLSTKKVFFEHP